MASNSLIYLVALEAVHSSVISFGRRKDVFLPPELYVDVERRVQFFNPLALDIASDIGTVNATTPHIRTGSRNSLQTNDSAAHLNLSSVLINCGISVLIFQKF